MARRWETVAGESRSSNGLSADVPGGAGEGGGIGGVALAGCAVVFLPAQPPRAGKVALWRPDGGPLPDLVARGGEEGAWSGPGGVEQGTLSVARRHGNGARSRTVPAVLLPVAEAVPLLVRARHAPTAHPAAACWGAATLHALHLTARGRILPGLTAEDTDAWRAGPLDAEDIAHLRAIAAAMPADAYAVPIPGSRPLQVTDPAVLVRLYVDAVIDALPRTPAAGLVAGAPYAASAPQHLPGAREWAAEVAAGVDAGVRLSLRLDLAPHKLFDMAEESPVGGAEERSAAAVLQVHSLTDPTLVADARDLWEGEGPDHFGPRSRVDTLLALRRAARIWAPLTRLLERAVPDVLPLGEDELYELLGEAAPRLGAAGVSVHWPKELARGLTAAAVLRPAPGSAADGFGFFDTRELLQFRWQMAMDGVPLTEAEMDALAEAHRPVVRLRDQWVLVDPGLVRKARKRELGYLEPVDALAATLHGTAEVDGEEVEVVPQGALAALRGRLTTEARPLPQPSGLRATLRDYQLRGMAWLDTMTSLGLGGCLADDMGLGKTLTVIALHLHRRPSAPVLVVCPASLLGNWQREIERFAPGTPVRRFHGAGRSLDGLDGGFVLTTYGTMRSSATQLAGRSWAWIVADEAQHVKNSRSSTAKALRGIKAPVRIALTGTPVENNLSELWALLDWTTPGLLGPLKTFRALHAREVEGGEDPAAAERLARLVRPFILRRKKSDPGIVPELPPKTETDHPVALGREQAALYQAVVRETLTRIETAEGIARRGLVMKLLTALKQICNHPAQYLKEAAPGLAARSGKLELLDELLDTILAEGGATLIFTQYVGMARLLERHLSTRGIPAQLLHGGTPVAERERMVDRFQSGHAPVFLLSLKAAGTGLNLTRAGHVIHYDRWWNPAVEEQATDRAYRIGQTQPVQVHRLIAEGTVEDNIAQLLSAKRALADAVLSGGETALTELSDAELADLVSLRRPG
ncbi:DEAD/DEAH box helicase [Streptomyces tubercidicus]|uniref:DEAD/DEAH box helicase n=1 Tax=Streptomyces tubercidicus TaxID=47759 RepID=UPI0032517C58